MRLFFAAVLLLVGVTAQAASIYLTGPERSGLLEGRSYNITWSADGIETVSLMAYRERTALGGEPRGSFVIPIAEGVPAAQGSHPWIVPWIDAIQLVVRLKGYDSAGREVAWSDRNYAFRPAVMANRTQDGIYLDLHQRMNQRLYVQRSGQLTHAYLSTSSAEYNWRSRNSHTKVPHDHEGTYRVLDKKPMHWSTLFQVEMPWAMRYHGGHFIHATAPANYHSLGTPASSGCNRLTESDARELYHMTPVGTRVVVIGPSG